MQNEDVVAFDINSYAKNNAAVQWASTQKADDKLLTTNQS